MTEDDAPGIWWYVLVLLVASVGAGAFWWLILASPGVRP